MVQIIILKKYTTNITSELSRSLHITKSIKEYKLYRSKIPTDKTIGFVPTMGALHQGHISLIKKAKSENDIVICSIFVNPTQFSQGEDFDKYPRTFERDVELLSNSNIDCIFAPNHSEMFDGRALCHVEPAAFSNIYEGRARPEFFRGIATVVTKLFNIIQPNIAYFGQKDISQCILIRRLVKDLNIPVDINVCETIREVDGLALSSRNAYLTNDERPVANILHKALLMAVALSENKTTEPIKRQTLIDVTTKILNSEKKVSKIEYVSIADVYDMKEIDEIDPNNPSAVISSAIRLGNVRLIDNLLIGKAKQILGKN